jgi:excisionase family DNA binding protein
MNLIEQLEARTGAMKVAELCELLGVDDKHIYRMAARGSLPSFHVGGAVRFDPQEVAKWLRSKYGVVAPAGMKPPQPAKSIRRPERQIA